MDGLLLHVRKINVEAVNEDILDAGAWMQDPDEVSDEVSKLLDHGQDGGKDLLRSTFLDFGGKDFFWSLTWFQTCFAMASSSSASGADVLLWIQ